jgi:eukaryotic-like serine/threonine-protein kinase
VRRRGLSIRVRDDFWQDAAFAMVDVIGATDGDREGEPDPLRGQVLGGRYRLDERLGEGGMGAMYRGHDLVLDRPVAIKLLGPELVDDEVTAQRFDREAHALSMLDHPNCVQVFDAGTTTRGGKYIVMQLLAGHELRELLTAVPMPPARAVALALQILRGLDHAHRRGLVHRDLKPENVFVVQDDDGHELLKLVDFGIVKLLSAGEAKLTRAGQVFGTPRYMSPEQVSGGKIDARADLYTLGVVMFEMLAGAPPFDADSAGMLMRMHVIADPPPLPESVPEEVRAVVARLLEKSPDDRFASARAVIDALEGRVHTEPAPVEILSSPAPAAVVAEIVAPVELVVASPAARPEPGEVTWIIPPRDLDPPRAGALRRENLGLRAVAMVLLVIFVALGALLCNSWRDAS